ncbi:hypothetical protein M0804_011630 [Polistes exclamans]|nr:hypothetical protein M0804_011630 [Polistes exclamans]
MLFRVQRASGACDTKRRVSENGGSRHHHHHQRSAELTNEFQRGYIPTHGSTAFRGLIVGWKSACLADVR